MLASNEAVIFIEAINKYRKEMHFLSGQKGEGHSGEPASSKITHENTYLLIGYIYPEDRWESVSRCATTQRE